MTRTDHPTRIETTGSLEQDDFVRALRWFAFKRRRWFTVACWALIVGGGVVGSLAYAANARPGQRANGLVMAVAAVFVLLVVVATQWYSLRAAAKRQYDSTPGVALPTRYVLDDEGLTAENTEVSSRQKWETFYQVHETDAAFVLMRSRVMLQVMPKRLFRDDAQVAEVRALIADRLGDKARLKSAS